MLWKTTDLYNYILLKTPENLDNINNLENNKQFYSDLEYDSENSNDTDLNEFNGNYFKINNLNYQVNHKTKLTKQNFDDELNEETTEILDDISLPLLINKSKLYTYNELKRFSFFKNLVLKFNNNTYFIDPQKIKINSIFNNKNLESFFSWDLNDNYEFPEKVKLYKKLKILKKYKKKFKLKKSNKYGTKIRKKVRSLTVYAGEVKIDSNGENYYKSFVMRLKTLNINLKQKLFNDSKQVFKKNSLVEIIAKSYISKRFKSRRKRRINKLITDFRKYKLLKNNNKSDFNEKPMYTKWRKKLFKRLNFLKSKKKIKYNLEFINKFKSSCKVTGWRKKRKHKKIFKKIFLASSKKKTYGSLLRLKRAQTLLWREKNNNTLYFLKNNLYVLSTKKNIKKKKKSKAKYFKYSLFLRKLYKISSVSHLKVSFKKTKLLKTKILKKKILKRKILKKKRLKNNTIEWKLIKKKVIKKRKWKKLKPITLKKKKLTNKRKKQIINHQKSNNKPQKSIRSLSRKTSIARKKKITKYLLKFYFKKKNNLFLPSIYSSQKWLTTYNRDYSDFNGFNYYINLINNIKVETAIEKTYNINNYLFLNKFSLENYTQQFYLFNSKVLEQETNEKKTFFFNFRNKRLKTYRMARKTHWSFFTSKTIKGDRYQKFLDVFLKKTKNYYFDIFTYFQFKFQFSYQFWFNFNKLYKDFYSLKDSYLSVLQFPIHFEFWNFIENYTLDNDLLEERILNWQERKIKIKKTFWMQQKKKIPTFFKKKIFNSDSRINTIQYDFITNYFIILKKSTHNTHTNLFIFKNKFLKLHGFRYNA